VRVENAQKPKWFTIHSEIEFDSRPDINYTGELLYYERVSQLGSSVASNAILDNHPGCYLFGALVAATPLLGFDERVATWEALYGQARDNANDIGRDAEVIGAPIIQVAQVLP
jgi:hypothetical protein